MIIQDRLLSVHGSNLSFSHIEEELNLFNIHLEQTEYHPTTFLPQRNVLYRNRNERNNKSFKLPYRPEGLIIGTVFGSLRGIGNKIHTKSDTDQDFEDAIEILKQVDKILIAAAEKFEPLSSIIKPYIIKNRFE